MWTNPGTRKTPADALRELLDRCESEGWAVSEWDGDISYFPPFGNGKISVYLCKLPPKPEPKPFARKLRRYRVQDRRIREAVNDYNDSQEW